MDQGRFTLRNVEWNTRYVDSYGAGGAFVIQARLCGFCVEKVLRVRDVLACRIPLVFETAIQMQRELVFRK